MPSAVKNAEAVLRSELDRIDKEIAHLLDQRKSKVENAANEIRRRYGNPPVASTNGVHRPKPAPKAAKKKGTAAPAKKQHRVPVIEYVRQILGAAKKEIATPELKQQIIKKSDYNEHDLRNLSQILFKAPSVYKKNGKVGLAEWKKKKAS